jgi:Ca-activated chloride channel family protein
MMSSKSQILCKFSTLAFLLLAIIVVATRAQSPNTQPPQTNEATIVLTAVDKDSHFVTTLGAEDLRILEDGKLQKITSFQHVSNQPVTLAILIDASASQERTLPGQKLAATSFVDLIMQSGKDEAAVATFTGTLKVEQKLTNEVKLLHQAIARAEFVPPQGYRGGGLVVGPLPPISTTPAMLAGSTAIWDAVLTVCHDLLLPSSGQGRHAIILLTDGEDTISKSKMADAIDHAIRDNVAIYSIGIGDSELYGVNKDALRKLSERTGGRAFFPKHGADFQTIFAEIGEDLRTQYIITYSPTTSAGSARKLRVEIVNPALRSADIQLSYPQVTPRK